MRYLLIDTCWTIHFEQVDNQRKKHNLKVQKGEAVKVKFWLSHALFEALLEEITTLGRVETVIFWVGNITVHPLGSRKKEEMQVI